MRVLSHREERLYQLFFHQVFDPIAFYRVGQTDPFDFNSVTFLGVNRAYETVMGVNRNDLIGKRFNDVWPESEQNWGQLIHQCITNKQAARYEGPSPATGRFLEAVAFYIAPDRVAVIFIDKTEWKKTDDALRQSRHKLRRLAAQLTLAEENTRRDIATDLHDRVGYSLVTLLRHLRSLQNEPLTPEGAALVSRCQKEVSTLIDESRTLIFRLSPPVLKEVGLNPALEALADSLLSPLGIRWVLKGRDESVFTQSADDAICILLYRMTRELLINIIKHAQARHVTLQVRRGAQKIQVIVEDDGRGFDPEKITASTGFGLFSIRERLITLGGNLNVISEPNQGTTVVMTAPRTLGKGEL